MKVDAYCLVTVGGLDVCVFSHRIILDVTIALFGAALELVTMVRTSLEAINWKSRIQEGELLQEEPFQKTYAHLTEVYILIEKENKNPATGQMAHECLRNNGIK